MLVKNTGNGFEAAPSGTHIARCIGLIGLGTHDNTYGETTRLRNVVMVTWELPHELREDGKPFVISKWYTRSLSDRATLRKDLANWRGRDFTASELQGFDLKNILDKGCQIVISENENGKVNVTGVAGLPKGTELPERHNDLKYFDIEEYDDEVFETLSDKLKEQITTSYEYNEIKQYGRVLEWIERKNVSEGKSLGGDTKAAAAVVGRARAYDDDETIPF